MKRKAKIAIRIFMQVSVLMVGVDVTLATSPHDSTWRQDLMRRLKAIYEDHEFQPKPVRAEWLPDSSGYHVRENDPKTNEVVFAKYSVVDDHRTVSDASQRDRKGHNPLRSPDGRRLLEFRGGNLFVRELETGRRIQLTERPRGRDVSYRRPTWSADSSQVVFVESDSTDVRQRSVLVPNDPSYPGVTQRRFARVGEQIEKLRVGVVKASGGETRWLPIETDENGFYLGQVEWAPNTDEVLVESMSRFRDRRDFTLFSTDNKAKTIFHESSPSWVVASQAKNAGITWVRDGGAFIVISEKDGWRHAYLYSRNGQELSLLTPGDYDIIDRAAVDEQRGWYYFYASPDNGTQQYLYRVPLKGSGKRERVSPRDQPGTHEYDFSPDCKWAFHTYSTMDTPPVVELVELEGHRVVRVLQRNELIRAKMERLASQPTEFFRLETGNGVSMDAWMIKPSDFDVSKQYPVFIYVYGEPHSQTVLDRWGAAQSHFHRAVAEMGYLVVSIDNRGTPAPKGAAWRRSIFGSLGPLSTDDQAAALKELGRTRPYVDLSRVGIWGWSGGGSNTLNAMFRKPDQYHVGIAVVPKPQPHLYNAWFQEIYMRTRDVNPDGYDRSAPIHFADGLKGDLMMITGSGETNTHIQIIEGLVDRLIELQKTFDYMVYPNRDHGLREGPGSVVHVRMLIARYLFEHLPAGARERPHSTLSH